MVHTPVDTLIACQQCAAELPVAAGSQFVTCAYCDTANFVDKTRVVLHYAVRMTVNDEAAVAVLRRWMAGNSTVKGLDRKANIETPYFEYFPMWMIRVMQADEERVFLEPAAALSVSELKYLTVPAADLESYQPYEMDAAAVAPTVPHEAMRQWLIDDHNIKNEEIQSISLVHLPIYRCKYEFNGRRYTALVDAATSKVFANIYPAKWEAPYLALGFAAFATYFCAAFIPIGGYLFDVTALGIGAYCIAVIVLAIPIFIAAAMVSAKV